MRPRPVRADRPAIHSIADAGGQRQQRAVLGLEDVWPLAPLPHCLLPIDFLDHAAVRRHAAVCPRKPCRESLFKSSNSFSQTKSFRRTVTAERVCSLRKRPRRVIVVVENRVKGATSRRVAEQMRIFRARLDQRHREVPRPGPVRRAADPNAHLPAAGAGVLLPRQQDGRTVWEDD